MAVTALTHTFRSLALSVIRPGPCILSHVVPPTALPCREFFTSSPICNIKVWKTQTKYTINPIGKKKTGGRDHTGRVRVCGIGGGHKQLYRMIDFQRLNYEPGRENQPFQEKVIQVRYDPLSFCHQQERRLERSVSIDPILDVVIEGAGGLSCPCGGAQYISTEMANY